ncbi:hypothetical protein JCM3765_006931 [Sporobolomyces pararoseus]
MTRPLPIGSTRQRRYKSCRNCRQSKTKCVGLDEEYLRNLDSPNYVHPALHLPQCRRCIAQEVECIFEPSRRKGRPRRIIRNKDQEPAQNRESSNPFSRSLAARHSPSAVLSSQPSPICTQNSVITNTPLAPLPSTSVEAQPQSPRSPSLAIHRQTPLHTLDPPSGASTFPLVIPPAPSRRIIPPRFKLETICESYLSKCFTWRPLLPVALDELGHHLSTCDPLLLVAINVTVNPSLDPPPFPSVIRQISLSTLQASVFLVTQALGVGNSRKAVEIVTWALSQLRRLGWRGNDTSHLSPTVERAEVPALVECGWMIHDTSIWVGVWTGYRNLFGHFEVEIPEEITAKTIMHHTLALLRDATDFQHFETLTDSEKEEYSNWIKERSERIYRAGVEDFLDSTTPTFNPSEDLEAENLMLASTREAVFAGTIISLASPILLLTRPSSKSCFLSSEVAIDLSKSIPLSPEARLQIRRATSRLLTVARTTRNRQGKLLALQPHCPCWGTFILIAAYGILVAADTPLGGDSILNPEGGKGGGSPVCLITDVKQVEEDISFLELVLNHENQRRWPQTEILRRKLESMKGSSPFLRKRTPSSLASLLN